MVDRRSLANARSPRRIRLRSRDEDARRSVHDVAGAVRVDLEGERLEEPLQALAVPPVRRHREHGREPIGRRAARDRRVGGGAACVQVACSVRRNLESVVRVRARQVAPFASLAARCVHEAWIVLALTGRSP